MDARNRSEPCGAPSDTMVAAQAAEAAADEARARFRTRGLPALPPDTRIGPLLAEDERLVAVHHAASIDRREPAPGGRAFGGVAGELYVTSRRLVLVGRLTVSFELEWIDDAVVSGDRLLLVLRDGHGVVLEAGEPRLLWVEIASARAAAGGQRAAL